jgi:LPPG:FO 2-phospho-L-lactate transferase
MMEELGLDATCVGVAREYAGFCDVFVIDEVDAHHQKEIEALGMRAEVADTVMETQADKVRLARHILGLKE